MSRNSLDAVSDRDFCVEFLSACALIMVHLSRLAEDVILYATTEFGFFELGDAIATGSSLMPQKKNPDSMEQCAARRAVFGGPARVADDVERLPLAYNKDMQEDKEAVFDAFDTVTASLQVTSTVLTNITVNKASLGWLHERDGARRLSRAKGNAVSGGARNVGRIVLCDRSETRIEDIGLERIARVFTAHRQRRLRSAVAGTDINYEVADRRDGEGVGDGVAGEGATHWLNRLLVNKLHVHQLQNYCGFHALRLPSMLIIPVTPLKSFVCASASRSFAPQSIRRA